MKQGNIVQLLNSWLWWFGNMFSCSDRGKRRHDFKINLFMAVCSVVFSGGWDGKKICLQCGIPGFYLWLGRSPGERDGTHSSTLAWKIPWTEEPGRLQSMGSLGVRHNWATSFSLFTSMHWRRKWKPTPVFLPGESQGWRSLVGCRLWGRTESDTTEVT